MAYLLDANVFIEAKNRYYGLDFCPAFWNWITAENHAGRLFSIEKVGDELRAIVDDLSVWSSQLGNGFFLPPDSAMLPALGAVSTWATSGQYEQSAVNTFLQKADYPCVSPFDMLRNSRARFVLDGANRNSSQEIEIGGPQ